RRDWVVTIAARPDAELRDHARGFAQEFGGLALAISGDQDFAVRLRESAMDGFGRGDGGLAPLATAVQNALSGRALENFDLRRVGMKVETVAHEGYGVEVIGGEWNGSLGLRVFRRENMGPAEVVYFEIRGLTLTLFPSHDGSMLAAARKTLR